MQKTFPRFLIDNFIDNRIKVLLSHTIVGHFHQFYFFFNYKADQNCPFLQYKNKQNFYYIRLRKQDIERITTKYL